MNCAVYLRLIFVIALFSGCSDPLHYTTAPDIQDTAAGDSTVDHDNAGLDGDDTAVEEDAPAFDVDADTALDLTDAAELGEDAQVPSQARLVVARFVWPVGMSSSDSYRLRTSSSANLVGSADSSIYRLSAIRFGVGR